MTEFADYTSRMLRFLAGSYFATPLEIEQLTFNRIWLFGRIFLRHHYTPSRSREELNGGKLGDSWAG